MIKCFLFIYLVISSNVALADENITEPLYAREFVAKYEKEICELPKRPTKEQKDACKESHKQLVLMRLKEAYPLADFKALNDVCIAHPFECKDSNTFEEWVRISQAKGEELKLQKDREANALYHQQVQEYQAQVEQERRQRIGNAIRAAGNAFAPPPSINVNVRHTNGF